MELASCWSESPEALAVAISLCVVIILLFPLQPNLKAESNKSLKKLNQELQSRLEEGTGLTRELGKHVNIMTTAFQCFLVEPPLAVS